MTHLIIAGHGPKRNGTFDPGASGYITKGEHRYMKEDLFPAMKKFLPKDHNVVFFDKYNVYDYGDIVSLAKKHKAKQVTEFHFDAIGNPNASGGHVIIYDRYNPDAMDLALRDAINDIVGLWNYSHRNHKGISGRNNLANVNRMAKAGITYRLLELGFGTNKKDAEIMTKNVAQYAKRLVEAIAGKAVEKEPSKPKTNAFTTYTVKPGDTLTRIANQYNTTVDAIVKFNNIKNKNHIEIGQKINIPTESKQQSNSSNNSIFKVGDKVILSKNATKYATGENIPAYIRGKTYTVQQVKTDRVLLKEIISWVFIKDVTKGTGGSFSSSEITEFKVGSKVKIKKSASKYATGQNIPSWVKGISYTILQIKEDKLLLKEIMSWVYKKDIE